MRPDHTGTCRRLAAGTALILSLLLCCAAGQLPDSAQTLAQPDGSTRQLRLAYLEELGWQVEEEREDTVILPAVFDSSYDSYLDIQKESGFDLTPYAGKTVTRYSYNIQNYPTGEENVLLDLLVYEGQIIGGDVRTADLNGFMKNIMKEEKAGCNKS